MKKTNLTVGLESDKIALLNDYAVFENRNLDVVIQEAIDGYLEVKQWQKAEIRKAIKEAEQGNFVPEGEMDVFYAKWTQ